MPSYVTCDVDICQRLSDLKWHFYGRGVFGCGVKDDGELERAACADITQRMFDVKLTSLNDSVDVIMHIVDCTLLFLNMSQYPCSIFANLYHHE